MAIKSKKLCQNIIMTSLKLIISTSPLPNLYHVMKLNKCHLEQSAAVSLLQTSSYGIR